MIKKLSFDLILNISSFLDIKSVVNLSHTNSRFKPIDNINSVKIKKRAAIIIVNFFYKIKNKYSDLRLSRKGYLINYKKLYKHPELYLNKKIQFKSTFQYYHYNLREDEIGEGTLYYYSNTNSWFFNLDNSFYNYLPDEPLPTHHLLYPAFIKNNSFRVIKN
jgi:hypothetical protein